jgi:hypothetical protein
MAALANHRQLSVVRFLLAAHFLAGMLLVFSSAIERAAGVFAPGPKALPNETSDHPPLPKIRLPTLEGVSQVNEMTSSRLLTLPGRRR